MSKTARCTARLSHRYLLREHSTFPGGAAHPPGEGLLELRQVDSSKKTQRFLAQFGGRVVLHFLPPYCPDDNRIERVWLEVHANVRRNHRSKTIEALMVQVVAFMRAYRQKKNKLNPSLEPAVAVAGPRSAA